MKICLILEGSYPFVRGGVSKWVNDMIRSMPEHEFIIWGIGDKEEKRGKYVVDLPPNVISVQEAFMDTALNERVPKNKNVRLNKIVFFFQILHVWPPDIQIKTFDIPGELAKY